MGAILLRYEFERGHLHEHASQSLPSLRMCNVSTRRTTLETFSADAFSPSISHVLASFITPIDPLKLHTRTHLNASQNTSIKSIHPYSDARSRYCVHILPIALNAMRLCCAGLASGR